MAPGTCARVTCIALEETGTEFETRLIRFMKGEHKSTDFKAINPKGKVPALVIDGEALTENVAIITYLAGRYPGAHLMPTASDEVEKARLLADLCFCAATLHPIVTRIRMPHFFATEDVAKTVWEKGCASMTEYFELINNRLDGQPWWYGDQWSAMDAYLYWVYWRVEGANFDTDPYPNYQAHAARMEERPSVQRALAREASMQEQLESEGLAYKPPPIQ